MTLHGIVSQVLQCPEKTSHLDLSLVRGERSEEEKPNAMKIAPDQQTGDETGPKQVIVAVAITLLVVIGGLGAAGQTAQSGGWQPPAGLKQVPIWPNAAPDMNGITGPPESIEITKPPDLAAGQSWTAVHDVTVPTMTIFAPKGTRTRAAVVVFPGGGFHVLAMDLEGTEVCDWLTSNGVTCILLKYRVPKSNHYWDKDLHTHVTPKVPRALQDAQRTIRLVRSRAKELDIDPNKIGVIGFSAGGYLVAQTSNIFKGTYKPVDDADKVSSRPDFAIALYPGHLCRGDDDEPRTFDPTLKVTKQAPPTFLVQAWDDHVDGICQSTMYARALDDAGVPAEVHLFAKGGHGFGLRPSGHPVSSWPTLAQNWLKEIGIL